MTGDTADSGDPGDTADSADSGDSADTGDTAEPWLVDEAVDVVIIGADTHVDKARFVGKAVYETSVGRALKETAKVMQEALAVRPPSAGTQTVKAEPRPAEKQAGPFRLEIAWIQAVGR